MSESRQSTPEPTIYLVDGTAYIYRAFHAIRHLSNSSGMPTNAVFGYTRMLLKLIEDRQPDYVALFFDAKGPTFRHHLYNAYKANRPPMPEDLVVQLPWIKEVTEAFNLARFEMSGYEADDLIGTQARAAEKEGFKVVIVTGDKDFMQLVTPRITIWDPMKDKRIDQAYIQEQYGIEPLQFIDVMGLWGDAADNVPGVPGVGEKTALKLIKAHHNMDRLYDEVHTITARKQREKLVQYKEQALLSRDLVTIRIDAPLEFDPQQYKIQTPDQQALAQLFKQLEFRQLQQAYPVQSDLSAKQYEVILTSEAFAGLLERLESELVFAFDTETTSTNPMAADLVGVSIATEPDRAVYIPCGHQYPGAPAQLGRQEILAGLQPLLENPRIHKIGQNIKYDWIVLSRQGVDLKGVSFDTMIASYLINPTKRAHSLDQIAMDFLDHKTITYEEVAGKGKKALGFDQVPLEEATPYACEDADITLLAHTVLARKLDELGLTDLFAQVEIPLLGVLMRMETIGIQVDKERLQELSQAFANELQSLEKQIYTSAGERFNIKSSQQLGQILFEKLDLPVQKKTRKRTGYSTDVDVLTTLKAYHELPQLVLRHRTLAKLKSTYADALLDLVNGETGRIHTSFNQTITATGRLSSSYPNLQNIPIRTPEGRMIRRAFVPREGWRFLSADYSQIELRILAHYSDDPILIKAFTDGEDIHARTASEVFQVFPQMVTDDLRRQAKVINFGIIYGMGAFSLSRELSISRKMAQTYIDNYFSRYSGVKQFINQSIERARRSKQTSTLLGRIRLLDEIDSSNRNVRLFAERTAINTPIQGTAADLIKLAMIQVDQAIQDEGLRSAMLLSVHDELVFEVPEDEAQDMEALVASTMEAVWNLKVPLKVNMAFGSDWMEAH
jgi:DNA polymerase-1